MARHDPPRSDELRDLKERFERIRSEIDQVSRETERIRSHADRSMKQRYWPERRRTTRVPDEDLSGAHHGNGDRA